MSLVVCRMKRVSRVIYHFRKRGTKRSLCGLPMRRRGRRPLPTEQLSGHHDLCRNCDRIDIAQARRQRS